MKHFNRWMPELLLLVASLAVVPVAGAANVAPVISGTPATTVVASTAYSFTPTASDANGDRLRFSIWNKPAWASFNTATGRLSGIAPATARTYTGIVIRVSDRRRTASLPAFSIQVTVANVAPVISGTPATTVAASAPYSFTPSASDANGTTLAFSIQNKPAWASFNAATGQLSGIAPATASTYPGIIISVSDGALSASLPAFSIQVTVANVAPVISGTPATTVAASAPYSFTPSASDANGTTLAFSIQNKPAWASFLTSTGQLSGTAPATAATYLGIVISVSDGVLSASLPAFSITVTAAPAPPVSFSWSRPTLNADGTTLSGLAGYRIYYGLDPASLTMSVQIPGASTNSYDLAGLGSGTWYFAITSYTNTGEESAASNVLAVPVP